MTGAYRTELQVVFEDSHGQVHHGRWSSTREMGVAEASAIREQFEQSMALYGCVLLSLQLISETESVVENPRLEVSNPVRPRFQLLKGGVAACSAWFLELCSDHRLEKFGSVFG